MAIQDIIAYILVAVAFAYAARSLYKSVVRQKSVDDGHGCSGNCNCDATKLRDELLKNKPID